MEIQNTIKTVLLLSIALSIALIVIGILILGCNGDMNPVKNSLSIYGGYFGGITTLVAAYIASRLFNDWRDQHNKTVIAFEAKNNFTLIHKERDFIHKLKFTCEDISNGKSKKLIFIDSFANDFEKKFLVLFNNNKDIMSSFCFLTHGQAIYDLVVAYRNEVEIFTKLLTNIKGDSSREFVQITKDSANLILNQLKTLEDKNEAVLNGLKAYIFVK